MRFEPVFSPVFRLTLKRLTSFLTRKYSQGLSLKTKNLIRETIESRLAQNPYLGPECDRLLDLGVPGYRQLLAGKHNIVIYRVDEQAQKIIVLLVFDSRQSLQKLLVDVNLMLP